MNKIIEDDIINIIENRLIEWSDFKNQTVLITGANGMLPAYMVYTLLYLNRIKNYNIRVLALVRNKCKAENKFADFLSDTNLQILVQDVCEKIIIPDPIDYIIHAASQASPKYYGIDPIGTINANVQGTSHLLQLARDKKCKSFLYFSSGEIYGNVNTDKGVSENDYGVIDPLKVRSCYGQSKRMGENLCICSNFQYGTNARIVRPFHCYGPGMLLDDGRVFADFIKNILNNENIILRSDGQAIRSFCYIVDATISFFFVLLHGKIGEAYNVGNPLETMSILDLAKLIISLYPEKQLVVKTEIIENDMRTIKMKSPLSISVPNISRLKESKYIPHYSAREGFKRTIDSFLK